MPKRMKADEAKILAIYAETKNGHSTARQLNLHYQTVVKVLRYSKGKCNICGSRPHTAGMRSCAPCAEKKRVKKAAKRDALKAAGLCTICNEPAIIGQTMCETHQVRKTRSQRRHRFGLDALAVWEAADKSCELCGQESNGSKGSRTHLHHIDCDESNGAPENLICLCQDCHWITHRLLLCRNPVALLSWFEKAYPDKPLRRVGSI